MSTPQSAAERIRDLIPEPLNISSVAESVHILGRQAIRSSFQYEVKATVRRFIDVMMWILVSTFVTQGAFGDPPQIAPYGAWRGRMRYVEGPHKVKERVRWGNGITPVGGQVLMQGIAVAGEVYGGSATGGASLDARSASDHDGKLDFWKQQSAAREQLTTNLNVIRSRNSLPSIEKLESVNAVAAQQPGAAKQPGAGKFDPGEDFIGVKAEVSAGKSKALFPQVAYHMNDVIKAWNSQVNELKGKRLNTRDLEALKRVSLGIKDAIKSGNDKVKFPFKTSVEFVSLDVRDGEGALNNDLLKEIKTAFNNLRFAQQRAAKYVSVHESEFERLTSNPESPFDAILLRNMTVVEKLSLMFTPENPAMQVFNDSNAVEPSKDQKRSGDGGVEEDGVDVIGFEAK